MCCGDERLFANDTFVLRLCGDSLVNFIDPGWRREETLVYGAAEGRAAAQFLDGVFEGCEEGG